MFTGVEVNVIRSALPPKPKVITLCLLPERKPSGYQIRTFLTPLRARADLFLKSWPILKEELPIIP